MNARTTILTALRKRATSGAVGRYPFDAETQTAITTPGKILHEKYLEPLDLTQKALANHLCEGDEPDGRAGKEGAGAPEPDAVVQISGSPGDEVPTVQISVSPDDEVDAVQISGSPASIAP